MKSTTDELVTNHPAIEFRTVSLSFGERPVLTEVNLTLRAGEMICITGAAGSGKSVLLRLAIGFHRPDRGRVLVENCDISDMDETELLKLRSESMGIVFQESSLFTSLSVYENAAYRLYEQGLSEKVAERRTNDVLRFVGLEDDADKLPEELSIGMRRRLEFARALVGWPPIMFFDEPASGLDPINARNILDLVINARDLHHVSSLFVTKEPWEIRYLSNNLAKRDGDSAAIVKAHQAMPAVSVMVLDRGHVAFHGNYQDFESSDLPAVRLMTQALRQPEYSNTVSANPWQTGTPRQFKLWSEADRKHSR